MVLLLNLAFGIIAFLIADYLLARVGVSDPAKLILAVIVGILVFIANFGAAVV